jgi:hypothetical protein
MTTRAKVRVGEITLWERDYAPAFDPKASATDQNYLGLAIPAAAWVLFRTHDEDNLRPIGMWWRRIKRGVIGQIEFPAATSDWQSYALFSLGVSHEQDPIASRNYYRRALDHDAANRAALFNLAVLDVEEGRFDEAEEFLRHLNEMVDRGRYKHRDPLWYRVQYMRAVLGLNNPAFASAAAPGDRPGQILLEMLIALEDTLIRPRKWLDRLRGYLSRPAQRQDVALKKVLVEFEGGALVALAGVMAGSATSLKSPNGGPVGAAPGDATLAHAVRDRPALRSNLQVFKDSREDDLGGGARAQMFALEIIHFVFIGNDVRRNDRSLYNFACFLALHTAEADRALQILEGVLAMHPERAAWAIADPSFAQFKSDKRFLAMVNPVPPAPPAASPTPVPSLLASYSMVIARPADQVFGFISDFENNPRWQRGVRSVRWTSKPPHGLGATHNQSGKYWGLRLWSDFKTIAYEPGERVTIESSDGPFPAAETRMVERIDDARCQVSVRVEGDARAFPRIAPTFLRFLVQGRIKADSRRLKHQLESTGD